MGKPILSKVRISYAEYIGQGGDTRGSETSQYPEEKKSNEIPLVAASEWGRAQTQPMTERNSVKVRTVIFKLLLFCTSALLYCVIGWGL